MGPWWNAVAIISDIGGRLKPGVILVEAKSQIPEIYGGGCQASPESRATIEAAVGDARSGAVLQLARIGSGRSISPPIALRICAGCASGVTFQRGW